MTHRGPFQPLPFCDSVIPPEQRLLVCTVTLVPCLKAEPPSALVTHTAFVGSWPLV